MSKPIADPDEKNQDRVDWVTQALAEFCRHTGQTEEDGFEEIVSDFLADLGHFCDATNLNLEDLLRRGADHYHAETNPEETDPPSEGEQGSQFDFVLP